MFTQKTMYHVTAFKNQFLMLQCKTRFPNINYCTLKTSENELMQLLGF